MVAAGIVSLVHAVGVFWDTPEAFYVTYWLEVHATSYGRGMVMCFDCEVIRYPAHFPLEVLAWVT